MNNEDLIKKLEKIDLPEVEFPSHQRQLKMALLNSGYFRKQTTMSLLKKTMSLLKKIAPIGAVAVIALFVVVGVNYFKNPSSVSRNNLLMPQAVYAKELVSLAQEQLTRGGIAGFPDLTTGIIQWKEPDADGNIRDEKGNIIFVTDQEGKLVPAPREVPATTYTLPKPIPGLAQNAGAYPNALFNDMAKARNTAYFYIVIKPAPLTNEQIAILRNFGVRMLQLPSQDEITMLKNMGVGISDEKSVYATLIEEDQVEKIKKLDFVVSVTLPQIKAGINEGGVDLNDVGSSDEISYTFTKDSFLSSLKEAENAKDLTYLGDKRVGDPAKPLSAVGRKIRIVQFTDNKGNTTILGIDENNLPVVRMSFNKTSGAGGGMIFQPADKGSVPNGETPGINYGKISDGTPQPNFEQQIKYWTENLEQPKDFKAIQK